MSATLINLIVQIIAGALAGNATGSVAPKVSLGQTGNSLAGAVGGLILGQLGGMVIPMLQAGGGIDIGSIVSQVVGGGVGGAVLTAIVGAIKNGMAKA